MYTRSDCNSTSAGDHHSAQPSHSPANNARPNTSFPAVEMDQFRAVDELEDDEEEIGLTRTEGQQRQFEQEQDGEASDYAREARNTSKAEEKLAMAVVVKNMAINTILIGLWYGFSISISVYNKWMFSKENLDFHFPLFITSIHMIVQFLLAALVLYLFPRFRPSQGLPGMRGNSAGVYSRLDETGDRREEPKEQSGPLMTPWFYLSRIAPCGTATALDIGLGNFSMRFISLTFYTMCKSSVLAFVLLFAFLFRLERPTLKLCTVILVMTIGVILMVTGEAAFNALGFSLVMTASFCSGFRWSLTQILLLRNPSTSNPFSSILFLTPVMFLALFILAMPIEGPVQAIAGFRVLCESRGTFMSILLLLFPGTLAFLMVAAEFALIKRTSVVTLSVCGIFKEVLTISAASLTFGDTLSPINISGLVVTILAIAAYNWIKFTKLRQEAREEAHQRLEGRSSEDFQTIGPSNAHSAHSAPVRRESTEGLLGEAANPPLAQIGRLHGAERRRGIPDDEDEDHESSFVK